MKRRALILNGEDMDTNCFSQNLRNYPLRRGSERDGRVHMCPNEPS